MKIYKGWHCGIVPSNTCILMGNGFRQCRPCFFNSLHRLIHLFRKADYLNPFPRPTLKSRIKKLLQKVGEKFGYYQNSDWTLWCVFRTAFTIFEGNSCILSACAAIFRCVWFSCSNMAFALWTSCWKRSAPEFIKVGIVELSQVTLVFSWVTGSDRIWEQIKLTLNWSICGTIWIRQFRHRMKWTLQFRTWTLQPPMMRISGFQILFQEQKDISVIMLTNKGGSTVKFKTTISSRRAVVWVTVSDSSMILPIVWTVA